MARERARDRIDVRSAQQMHDAVLPLAAAMDIFVATAAVADWRPSTAATTKIKKDASGTLTTRSRQSAGSLAVWISTPWA